MINNDMFISNDTYLGNGSKAELYLQNGAVWNNIANNTRYEQDNEDVGNGEESRLTYFHGGKSANTKGIIRQQSASKNLVIDNYDGHTLLTYDHDAETPSNIFGGTTTIKSAAKDSSITLRTDNNGIDVNDSTLVSNVLNNLAGKLYYTGVLNNENNLRNSANC